MIVIHKKYGIPGKITEIIKSDIEIYPSMSFLSPVKIKPATIPNMYVVSSTNRVISGVFDEYELRKRFYIGTKEYIKVMRRRK